MPPRRARPSPNGNPAERDPGLRERPRSNRLPHPSTEASTPRRRQGKLRRFPAQRRSRMSPSPLRNRLLSLPPLPPPLLLPHPLSVLGDLRGGCHPPSPSWNIPRIAISQITPLDPASAPPCWVSFPALRCPFSSSMKTNNLQFWTSCRR